MRDQRSIGLAMLSLLLVLTSATACVDEREPPLSIPPGPEKVDIGGRKLGYRCLGEGTPTVVVEPGLGDSGRSWMGLQPRIAEFTRVCLYSRAGLGRSDPARPGPRSVEHVVEELHAFLAHAEIEGPYVLVAASLGGIHARAYAARFPDEIAGMVLIDTTLAHSEEEDARSEARKTPAVLAFDAAWPESEPQPSRRPPEGISDFGAYIAAAGELPRLGDIPLVVLGASNRFDFATWRSNLPEEVREVYERHQEEIDRYVEGAQDMVSRRIRDQALLSTRGRYVEVEDAGHQIHRDQPDRVLEAIRKVVEAARR